MATTVRRNFDSQDLETNWSGYLKTLKEAHGKIAGVGSGTLLSLWGKDRNNYLALIDRCSDIFEQTPSFSSMSLEERQVIAGIGSNQVRWMGSIGASGLASQAVNDRADEIAEALDEIPLDRDRRVSSTTLQTYFERATEIRGIAVASASRFLTTKRPDLFMSVNGANQKNLERAFGAKVRKPEGYIALHERIWSFPWFSADRNRNDRRGEAIWRARVALLDALFYDGNER